MLGLSETLAKKYQFDSIFTCYFFDDVGLDCESNQLIYCSDSMQYCSIANCCRCDAEQNSHCCRANYCPPSHGTLHRSDLSDCRPPNGNSADASNMFSPYTSRTYRDICTPDAFHFEHAENGTKTENKSVNATFIYDNFAGRNKVSRNESVRRQLD